jgi:hypothetical protein
MGSELSALSGIANIDAALPKDSDVIALIVCTNTEH